MAEVRGVQGKDAGIGFSKRAAYPCRFGDYLLIERIASGGMCAVHKAQDRSGGLLALKTVRGRHMARNDPGAGLRAEARILKRLALDGLPCYLGSGAVEGVDYLAMGLFDGMSLHQASLCRTLGRMPAARAILGCCRIMAQVHERGVVHRDLKPGNILVSMGLSVLVIDFGLAKASWMEDRIRRDRIVGTYAFLPPEQLEGPDVERRADIYSLGASLYFALSGRLPFVSTNRTPRERSAHMQRMIRSEEPRPIEEAAPGIDPDLCAIVRKAMMKDPSRRYQSMEEMAEALARFLGS